MNRYQGDNQIVGVVQSQGRDQWVLEVYLEDLQLVEAKYRKGHPGVWLLGESQQVGEHKGWTNISEVQALNLWERLWGAQLIAKLELLKSWNQ